MYRDPNVIRLGSSTLYYRLRQVDVNGNYEFSDIIEVLVDLGLDIWVEVYPNPASEFVFFDYNSFDEKDLSFELFNESGQKLYARTLTETKGTLQLDIKSFSKGIYLIRAFNENTTRTAKFLIK